MVIKGIVIVLAVAIDQLAVACAGQVHPISDEFRTPRQLNDAGTHPCCAATILLLVGAGCRRADMNKPLIVIVVPSQDNPFFKAEADAAAARARALGYRVRVDAHDDDAYRQDNLIDAAIASNAAALILDNAGAELRSPRFGAPPRPEFRAS